MADRLSDRDIDDVLRTEVLTNSPLRLLAEEVSEWRKHGKSAFGVGDPSFIWQAYENIWGEVVGDLARELYTSGMAESMEVAFEEAERFLAVRASYLAKKRREAEDADEPVIAEATEDGLLVFGDKRVPVHRGDKLSGKVVDGRFILLVNGIRALELPEEP